MLALGVVLIWKFPQTPNTVLARIPYVFLVTVAISGLFLMPEAVFAKDLDIWGTRSEYAQSSSYRATYNTMYDARKVYDICGISHLTFRDIWKSTASTA